MLKLKICLRNMINALGFQNSKMLTIMNQSCLFFHVFKGCLYPAVSLIKINCRPVCQLISRKKSISFISRVYANKHILLACYIPVSFCGKKPPNICKADWKKKMFLRTNSSRNFFVSFCIIKKKNEIKNL